MDTQEILSKFDKTPVISSGNLELLLGKSDSNLTYWLKKLVNDGVLIKLKNGLFFSKIYEKISATSLADKERLMEYVANRLRVPSYVSLEYVLSKYSFIPESVFTITSITTKSTRSYMTGVGNYIYKNIKAELYYGFLELSFSGGTVTIASLAKAIFDYLYLKKFSAKKFIKPYLLSDGRLNWYVLTDKDKNELIAFIETSKSAKMLYIKKILRKEGIL